MLTVTRTLTVLYSITLLTIFTNIQLSLLGRYKYIQSVIQMERSEEARARRKYESSASATLFSSLDDIEAFVDQRARWEEDSVWHEGVDAETERKYLTLSWWILNVGWKDVGERVRRGVEEVFEGVSLKSKIGALELHRLISDVRRRVEHEITFEGTERKINFLSTLMPPTSSALSLLLTRGGFPHSHSDTHEPAFAALLEETRDLLTSSDFALVLERALDRSTTMLFDGLSQNVFVGEEDEGEVRLRTAGVLPGLARWSSLALNGMPNELVDCLSDSHEVAGFSAIIYSNYGDHFR
jgi:peroxin-3